MSSDGRPVNKGEAAQPAGSQPHRVHLEYVWTRPPLPGKFACFLIIFLKEKMKGFQGFSAQSAPVAAQRPARSCIMKPFLGLSLVLAAGCRLCEEGEADLISQARSCLALAVTDGTSSSETSRPEKLFWNWVRCPLKPRCAGRDPTALRGLTCPRSLGAAPIHARHLSSRSVPGV